jgi:hypothetical protein
MAMPGERGDWAFLPLSYPGAKEGIFIHLLSSPLDIVSIMI